MPKIINVKYTITNMSIYTITSLFSTHPKIYGIYRPPMCPKSIVGFYKKQDAVKFANRLAHYKFKFKSWVDKDVNKYCPVIKDVDMESYLLNITEFEFSQLLDGLKRRGQHLYIIDDVNCLPMISQNKIATTDQTLVEGGFFDM